jgi:hypothetical protein
MKAIKRITRKDIAQLIDLTVRQVVAREIPLGLKACRLPVRVGREVVYHAGQVEKALRERKLIE